MHPVTLIRQVLEDGSLVTSEFKDVLDGEAFYLGDGRYHGLLALNILFEFSF